MNFAKTTLMGLALGLGLTAANTNAAITVSDNITTDTTWAAGELVHLTQQIFVTNGATLTIEEGVVVASFEDTDNNGVLDGGGSLAVARGSQIFVNGTADSPVIMTSASDVGTWTGSVVTTNDGPDATPGTDDDYVTAITTVGNPQTGVWREQVNEWGNLTIMGRGVISSYSFEDADAGPRIGEPFGPVTPANANPLGAEGTDQRQMEGLTAPTGNEFVTFYGGAQDDDDSGTISYLSLRYTGLVIGLGNELNGLSLGGIGYGTDISHVEVMNNVDDGIEIWGGMVNLKYVSIWNVGDDSFDVDQGWRGKAQFGLIVQGFGTDAGQGSGVGDNCIEIDGAEDSDDFPQTTAVIENFTVIGQPGFSDPDGVGGAPDVEGGDGATTWRDNARVQYNRCIFMDIGEELVRDDGDDGDGGEGYGFNSTHTFYPGESGTELSIWEIDYDPSTFPAEAQVNEGSATQAVDNSAVGGFVGTKDFTSESVYTTQYSGKLAQITDSVIWNIDTLEEDEVAPKFLAEATAVGVFDVANNNVNQFDSTGTMPIVSITRDTPVIRGGRYMERVISLNPRAAGAATTSVDTAPADGFFTPVTFRGAFSADTNWAEGWTASSAFGFYTGSDTTTDPDVSIAIADINTEVSFPTVSGVLYTVLRSNDGQVWTPLTVIVGDGNTLSYEDLVEYDASVANFYDVIAQ